MSNEKKTPAKNAEDKTADKTTEKKSKAEQLAEQEATLRALAAKIVGYDETTKAVTIDNDEATKAYIGSLPEGLSVDDVKNLRRHDQNFAAAVTAAATPHIINAMKADDAVRTVALDIPMANTKERVQVMADRDNGLSIAINLPLTKTGNIKAAYETFQSAIDDAFGEDD